MKLIMIKTASKDGKSKAILKITKAEWVKIGEENGWIHGQTSLDDVMDRIRALQEAFDSQEGIEDEGVLREVSHAARLPVEEVRGRKITKNLYMKIYKALQAKARELQSFLQRETRGIEESMYETKELW